MGRWSDKLIQHIMNLGFNPFSYQEKSYTQKIIKYMIDWRYRTIVKLSGWLDSALDDNNPVLPVLDKKNDTYALHYLNKIRREIQYVSDAVTWKVTEYWQTPQSTIELGVGDCEDGAILLYHYLVGNGVDPDRLLICAGDVQNPYTGKTTGHCWLAYKPNNYPTQWVFLDWCYYFDHKSIRHRDKYFIYGKEIYNFGPDGQTRVPSKYKNIWFAFNHKKSYVGLK